MTVWKLVFLFAFVSCTAGLLPGAAAFRPIHVDLALPDGGAVSASSIGTSGDLVVGYTTATPNTGAAPYATAVFSITQNGVVVSEIGVPASPPTTAARIFVDCRNDVASGSGTIDINTGLAIVNAGASTATVTLQLRDLQGNLLASGTFQVNAYGHLSKYVDEFSPGFVLPQNFATAYGFGTLEISSDQPVSILALRSTLNQRSEYLFTSTPVADLTSDQASTDLYFPQIADGGGYQTNLILMNTSDASESGTIFFLDDSGSPLPVTLADGVTTASQFSYTVPANGVFRLVTNGAPAQVVMGWVKVEPTSGYSPVGLAVFGYVAGGILTAETGVPSTVASNEARIYVDMTGGHDTGLGVVYPVAGASASAGAVLNGVDGLGMALGADEMTVTLTALGLDGQALTTVSPNPATFTIPANGHKAKYVHELFESGLDSGFTGILSITSASPFAALTIRSLLNSRGEYLFATFPTAHSDAAAPSPVIFPQVAAGAGYQSEFIFLDAGAASSVTVQYWDDDGLPLTFGAGTVTSTNYSQSGGTVVDAMEIFSSSTQDLSGVKVTNSGSFTLAGSIITTSGNSSDTNQSSQVGLNAGVLVNSSADVALSRCSIVTTGSGANGLFATGSGSTAVMSHGSIYATGGNAHGVDVTYGGTITLDDVDIYTEGGSGAALATDFGGGTLNITGGTMVTTGIHSPGIYSTGVVSVTGATITAEGSEGAVIDGSNSITITDTTLYAAKSRGVMMFNSMSTISGSATFTVDGGSFTAAVGPLFYVTNAAATINVSGAELSAVSGVLLKASTGDWGSSGGTVTFNADGQALVGNMEIDSSSSVAATLQNSSSLTGAIDAANTGKTVGLTLDSSSSWTVTANSHLATLSDAAGISGTSVANIVGNGCNVYYDSSKSANGYLGGKTYSLVNGGQLIPE